MQEYTLFDIIGPKMIGPSSSHTAGAARIGLIARMIAGNDIKAVRFILHGSFAKTYKGHGTDKALLAGVLGIKEDDEQLKNAMSVAQSLGISYVFETQDLGDVHANTVKVVITDSSDRQVEIIGSSVGGGSIKIVELNEMPIEFYGEYTTLITHHDDSPGIIARVTDTLAREQINVAFMRVFRQSKGLDAFMVIKLDQPVPARVVTGIEQGIPGIKRVYLLNPLSKESS